MGRLQRSEMRVRESNKLQITAVNTVRHVRYIADEHQLSISHGTGSADAECNRATLHVT